MKILVAVKGVPDYAGPIRVLPDGSNVDTSTFRKVINPFDEIAVEEAVRLKEKGQATEIIAVSMGVSAVEEILRTALAMGADRGVLIETDQELQPLAVATVLAVVAKREGVSLCFLGKQAVDTDNNQTGQMLAGRLGWAQGTFASRVTLNEKGVEVIREIDGGLETVQLALPAVITTDLRLNQPRYLSLPNIVQAKRKSIGVQSLSEMGLDVMSHLQTLKVSIPEKHRAGRRVESVAELVACLRGDGVIG